MKRSNTEKRKAFKWNSIFYLQMIGFIRIDMLCAGGVVVDGWEDLGKFDEKDTQTRINGKMVERDGRKGRRINMIHKVIGAQRIKLLNLHLMKDKRDTEIESGRGICKVKD